MSEDHRLYLLRLHNNGTYEVLFLPPVPGNYKIMMVLEYSLCDGYKEPPIDWFIKGKCH